ncbi:hypothetical protein [Mycobacterium sp. IDR2000157661]|uniref:hypothetical protein n=1 Tax=Mycobacterium sp. IDR2000157661 TaxID=2867005 RepID=UPI001EEBB6D1|nr:hypothetical protein [Mycobacterium sp. IDR2000157661]ULE34161.1 hypothetical protein K3G64_05755 [Mycobacterium sp. IDR2000157661]
MPQPIPRRTAAGLLASVAAMTFVPPASAAPLNPIPGNGFFIVGTDIEPGLYQTAGSASTWAVWINDVPTQDSMCAWFTYSTPDTNKDNVVATNISIGPMFANINSTVMAFESRNCQPWTRVP